MTLTGFLDGLVKAPRPFSDVVWICILALTGCALVAFLVAMVVVSNLCARRCSAVRYPCCGAYRVSEDSEEKAAMAASFVSTPRSVKRIVSCGVRLARPPVLLAWLMAGLLATAPLLLLEFFDWTSRAFGAVSFSEVTASFAASPSLVLLLWFELACVILWAALAVVEVVLTAVVLIHHLRVLALFRGAFVADLSPATTDRDVDDDAEASVDKQQAAREERFQAAAISRSHGHAVAIVWILRAAASVAAFLFAGLQVSAPGEDGGRLIHTVMAAAGGVGIAQILGAVFIIIRHERIVDKERRASIKRLPPVGVDPLLARNARRSSGGASQHLGGPGAAAPPVSTRDVDLDLEGASGVAFDASLVLVEEPGRHAGHAAAARERRRSSAGAGTGAAAAAATAAAAAVAGGRSAESYRAALDEGQSSSPRGTGQLRGAAARRYQQPRTLRVVPVTATAGAEGLVNTPHYQPSVAGDTPSSYAHSHPEPTSPVAQRFSISGVAVPMLDLHPQGGSSGYAALPRQRRASVGSPAAVARESPRRLNQQNNPTLPLHQQQGTVASGASRAAIAAALSPGALSTTSTGGGSPSGRRAASGGSVTVTSTVLRDRLAAFFARHDPGRLAQAAVLARGVLGDAAAEAELLASLQREYSTPVPNAVKVVRSSAAPSPALLQQRGEAPLPSASSASQRGGGAQSVLTGRSAFHTQADCAPEQAPGVGAPAGRSQPSPPVASPQRAPAKSPRRLPGAASASPGGSYTVSPRRALSATTRSPLRPLAGGSAAASASPSRVPLLVPGEAAAALPPTVLAPATHLDNSGLLLAQQLQQVAQAHIAQAVQLQQAAQLFAQQQRHAQPPSPGAGATPTRAAAATVPPRSPGAARAAIASTSSGGGKSPSAAAVGTTPRGGGWGEGVAAARREGVAAARSPPRSAPGSGGSARRNDALPPRLASPRGSPSIAAGSSRMAAVATAGASPTAAYSARGGGAGGGAGTARSTSDTLRALATSARSLRGSPRGSPGVGGGRAQAEDRGGGSRPRGDSEALSEPAAVAAQAAVAPVDALRSESEGADPTN